MARPKRRRDHEVAPRASTGGAKLARKTHATSRRRPAAATAPPPPPPPPPSFDAWLGSQGVWYNHALLDLRRAQDASEAAPCAIYARQSIPEGAALASIPKAAVLSRRTAACAALLEARRLGGGLALAVAVMGELLRGDRSRWHGYLRTLPLEGEAGVPALWVPPADEQGATPLRPAERLLAGTEAQGFARLDARDVARDYASLVEPALVGTPARRRAWLAAMGGTAAAPGSPPPQPPLPSLALFRRAASLVSSRAFRVDAWHGDAMVPVADAFNHKASCVSLGEGFVVTELQEQQEEEEEDDDDDNEDDEDDEDDEASAGGRGIPVMSTAPPTSVQNAAPPAAWRRWGLPLRLEIAIISDDGEDEEEEEEEEQDGGDDAALPPAAELSAIFPGVLRIVAASDVPAGREVHNTYGELPNVDLVRKYGFCLRPEEALADEDDDHDAAANDAPPLPAQAAAMGVHRVSNPFDRVRLSPQAFIEGALALLVVGGGGGRSADEDPARALAAAVLEAGSSSGGKWRPFLTREQLVERVAWLKSATDLLDAAVGENGEEEEDEDEESDDDDDDDDDDGGDGKKDDDDGGEETPEQCAARQAADRVAAERLVEAVETAATATAAALFPPSTPLPARLLGDGAVAALPGAAASRAAFLVSRALSAPRAEFAAWRTVDDALAPAAHLAARAAAARRARWAAAEEAQQADPLAEAFSDEVPILLVGRPPSSGAAAAAGGEAAYEWPRGARALLAYALARRLELYKQEPKTKKKRAAGESRGDDSTGCWFARATAAGLLSAADARALLAAASSPSSSTPPDNNKEDKGLAAASGLRAAEQRLLLHALCATNASSA
jgi:hypothetical protein